MGEVVKIDSGLLKEIENFLEKRENKIKYQSKKHFIDMAVFEFLNAERERGKEERDKNIKNINKNKLGYKKRGA